MNDDTLFPVRVWVIDSSALIAFKGLLPVSTQWDDFKVLEQKCIEGVIAMPRQVINEVEAETHPDIPGAWVAGMRNRMARPINVTLDHVAEVVRSIPEVVDASKQTEDADPYVVAMALQLRSNGLDPCVVTGDRVDRQSVSVASACAKLGIHTSTPEAFLIEMGLRVKQSPPPKEGD